MTRFGRFDDAAREYVITRPETPLPFDQLPRERRVLPDHLERGRRLILLSDARLRRLTRYRYNAVPADAGASLLYLRDAATGEFWSPSWQPVRTELED